MSQWKVRHGRPSQLWLSQIEWCQSCWSVQQRQLAGHVIVETALVDLTTVLALNWKKTKYLKKSSGKCESQLQMELKCEYHLIDYSLPDGGEFEAGG